MASTLWLGTSITTLVLDFSWKLGWFRFANTLPRVFRLETSLIDKDLAMFSVEFEKLKFCLLPRKKFC